MKVRKSQLIIILMGLSCSVTSRISYARYYAVRDWPTFIKIIQREPLAVVYLYSYERTCGEAQKVHEMHPITPVMYALSKSARYRFAHIAFIAMNVTKTDAVQRLPAVPLPLMVLYRNGKPLPNAVRGLHFAAQDLVNLIEQLLGYDIDQQIDAKKQYLQEMEMRAINTWGFYAPYRYAPS